MSTSSKSKVIVLTALQEGVSVRRAGKMHHLGVGRAHTGKAITILIDEKVVQVVEDKTGEILTTHLIDGAKNYWAKLPSE